MSRQLGECLRGMQAMVQGRLAPERWEQAKGSVVACAQQLRLCSAPAPGRARDPQSSLTVACSRLLGNPSTRAA